MSVIVAGATRKHGIVIAADSEIATTGAKKLWGSYPKLWSSPAGYIFGAAGGIRAAQAVRFHVPWPRLPHECEDAYEFAVSELVPAIREGVQGHGIIRIENNTESLGADLIVAWGDNFVLIGDDFSVILPSNGRAAIGAGASEAYGALGDVSPITVEAVIEAARRATLTAQGVGGEIYYITHQLESPQAFEG